MTKGQKKKRKKGERGYECVRNLLVQVGGGDSYFWMVFDYRLAVHAKFPWKKVREMGKVGKRIGVTEKKKLYPDMSAAGTSGGKDRGDRLYWICGQGKRSWKCLGGEKEVEDLFDKFHSEGQNLRHALKGALRKKNRQTGGKNIEKEGRLGLGTVYGKVGKNPIERGLTVMTATQ